MAFLAGPLMLLLIVVVVAVVASALAGRSQGPRAQVSPYGVFLLGLCFASIIMSVVAVGVTTHGIANLVGPSPVDASFVTGDGPVLPDNGNGVGSVIFTPGGRPIRISPPSTAPAATNETS